MLTSWYCTEPFSVFAVKYNMHVYYKMMFVHLIHDYVVQMIFVTEPYMTDGHDWWPHYFVYELILLMLHMTDNLHIAFIMQCNWNLLLQIFLQQCYFLFFNELSSKHTIYNLMYDLLQCYYDNVKVSMKLDFYIV